MKNLDLTDILITMTNENKKYIDQLSEDYLRGFGSEIAKQAAEPVKIEPGKPGPKASTAVNAAGIDALGNQTIIGQQKQPKPGLRTLLMHLLRRIFLRK